MLWRPSSVVLGKALQPEPLRDVQVAEKAASGCREEGTQFRVSTPLAAAEVLGRDCATPPSICHRDSWE